MIRIKRSSYLNTWPIDENAKAAPEGWISWPQHKRFALVLTHDVETSKGHDNCEQLMKLEMAYGFHSSFNFVPERYHVMPGLRALLRKNGFEVGLHGLNHDGMLFSSKQEFIQRARQINRYLKNWNAVGFRSPAMHHNLDWIHELNIQYDASTFDIDPFEPQPDGMGTIFPFFVNGRPDRPGYVELPYTLPQDYTLFVLMREKNIGIWKKKLDWIVAHGGMALLNTHPDYMNFDNESLQQDEYPIQYYEDLLDYIKKRYAGQYWQALPRSVATFYKSTMRRTEEMSKIAA